MDNNSTINSTNLELHSPDARRALLRANRLRSLRLAAFACLVFVGCGGSNTAPTLALTSDSTAPVIETGSAVAPQTSYADTVARVTPAVVTVNSERRVRASASPFFDDPRFREFFGDRLPQQDAPRQRQSGVGSGVIISNDGYILTNHHVVEGSERITITLSDNRDYQAKIIGSDPASDLAVLKIEAQGLPIVRIGNSDGVRVGDIVLAIGNPLGIGQTVTSGIISAKGRSTGLGDGSFEEFLQTDAPINRGNSGGALVNTNGELVGINSQILSPSGGSIGIGFAIPSNMARNVMDQLIKGGKVRRSILGVRPQDVTSDIARSLNLEQVRGVLVNEVTTGSAADRAGIRVGDLIVKLNGEPVLDSNSFRNRVAGTPPDTEVTLTISRDGREQDVRARLVERTEETASVTREPAEEGATGQKPTGALGVALTPLTADQATQRKLPAGINGGLLVQAVDPEGAAGDAGITTGDVIVSANRQPVRTAEDLRTAIERAGGRPLLLLVNRRLGGGGGGDLPGREQPEEGSPRTANIFLTVTPRATTTK